MKQIKRGEIYFADLSPVVGSEQTGLRPVLILQNNSGNRHSPTTITERREKRMIYVISDIHGSCIKMDCSKSENDSKIILGLTCKIQQYMVNYKSILCLNGRKS